MDEKKRKTKKGPSKKEKAIAFSKTKSLVWAKAYTMIAILLSCLLNGFASVRESGQQNLIGNFAPAIVGGIIPILVWVLGTVTAWTYGSGLKILAKIAGGVSACLLLLSVSHVATAISILTGSSLVMSCLLAIGIDCGLVVSEVIAIVVSEPQ